MPTYKVFLGHIGGLSRDYLNDLCRAVRTLFVPVIDASAHFDTLSVRIAQDSDDVDRISDHDLLCYVMQSNLDTVVAPYFSDSMGGDSDGFTSWRSNITGSEVYAGQMNAEALSFLVYHEFLHNKRNWTDRQLHRHGSLAASPVSPPQNQHDISLLAQVLHESRPQWLGGWAHHNDPLRGL